MAQVDFREAMDQLLERQYRKRREFSASLVEEQKALAAEYDAHWIPFD